MAPPPLEVGRDARLERVLGLVADVGLDAFGLAMIHLRGKGYSDRSLKIAVTQAHRAGASPGRGGRGNGDMTRSGIAQPRSSVVMVRTRISNSLIRQIPFSRRNVQS